MQYSFNADGTFKSLDETEEGHWKMKGNDRFTVSWVKHPKEELGKESYDFVWNPETKSFDYP